MVPVWARQASGPTGLNRLLTVPALKEWLKDAPVVMPLGVAAGLAHRARALPKCRRTNEPPVNSARNHRATNIALR
jgi:hypothetical protein